MALTLFGFFIFAQFVYVLWNAFHGFDITDEAYYFINYKQPPLYYTTTLFGHFAHILYGWLSLNVLGTRIASIIETFIFSGFLAYTLNTYLRLRYSSYSKEERLFFSFFVLSGGISALMAPFPRGLSYNRFVADAFCLFLGCLLHIRSMGRENFSKTLVWIFGIGASFFIVLVNKTLSGVVLILSWPALGFWIFSQYPLRRRFELIALTLLSTLICVTTFFSISDLSLSYVLSNFLHDSQAIALMGHNPQDLIHEYRVSIEGWVHRWLHVESQILFSLLFGGFLFFLSKKKFPKLTSLKSQWLWLVFLFWSFYLINKNLSVKDTPHSAEFILSIMITLLVFLFFFRNRKQKLTLETFILCTGVGILSFLGVFGTNNPFFINFDYFNAILFCGIAILIAVINKKLNLSFFAPVAVLLFVYISIVPRFYFFGIQKPYRISAPLSSHTKKVGSLPRSLSGLFLSEGSFQMVELFQYSLAAYSLPHSPVVLPFYHAPGVALFYDGTVPGFGWIVDKKEKQMGNCYFLSKIPKDTLKNAVVVFTREYLYPETTQCFESLGISLEQDFKLVKEIDPVTSGWKLQHTKIYLPNLIALQKR